ncbi:uncharacterized protein N7459_007069 [Penicillium hispanicum]|uniref:uncharacterized protein n=1 Tax=Penicillium hispanicum TaxID=1080232 RepID=UPI0025405682|nr:uncharacterized protein N7459_007069 [Penicillium hispanicum]KAJ5578105.1 hypothetical protein N7459_007069 [Penicillium hispanicum]
MDLLSVLPTFATKPYAHILPPLERSKITTVDLITLDILEIAKRAHVPPADVRRLSGRIVEALHADLGFEKTTIESTGDNEPSSSINAEPASISPSPATKLQPSRWQMVSTLDPAFDALLGGGIPTGYVTEVTGESGSGKTQFLLSLLLAVQLPKPHGLQKSAIYISTEHPLATTRLSQLLQCHPLLSTLPAGQAPSLQRILSINAMDLETQDHIINYQLPVAITRYDVGLVIIDSVTSNYRAEHSSNSMSAILTRSTELAKLGQLLRNLAVKEDVAVVLANQVSDRFESAEGRAVDSASRPSFPSVLSQSAAMTARESVNASPLPRNKADNPGAALEEQSSYNPPSSSPASSPYPVPEDDQFDGSYLIGNPARNETLSLLHQERFFTGWGDGSQLSTTSLKTPALGFFWSTQIACRIALKKEIIRTMAALWEGPYPILTPREQTGSQDPREEAKPSNTRPGFSSARETQTETEKSNPEHSACNENQRPESLQSPTKETLSQKPPLSTPHEPEPEHITRRSMKLVFAPWTAGSTTGPAGPQAEELDRRRSEVEFEIWKGGLRACRDE